MAEKKFSVVAIVVAAAISFIISGIGGAILSEWLARPKPLLTISAVGFLGTDEQVSIPDSLRDLSKDSAWIKNYRKFESFGTLSDDYEDAERIKLRLERGLALVEDWIESNEVAFQRGNSLTIKELGATPYMQDEIVGSSLVGMARRGEIASAPVPLDALREGNPVTELAKLGDKYLLYMGDRNIAFPFGRADTETEKRHIELLAYSFAYGNGDNIVYYMRRMAEASNREIRQLVSLLESLERSMLPATTLSVRAEIFNSGRKPVVVKPFGLFRVVNDDIERKDHLLRVAPYTKREQAPESFGILNRLDDLQNRSGVGSDVVVEGFLPAVEDRSYVLVPPNSSVSLALTSNDVLGDSGSRLRAIFDANVLRAELILIMGSGGRIQSDATVFGSSASKDLQRELSLVD